MQLLFWSQLTGVILGGGWLILSGEPVPSAGALATAAGAGLSLLVSQAALFQAMVVGTMSIVAPITGVGVVVPIFAGIVSGDRVRTAQAIGMAALTLGVVFASRQPGKEPDEQRESGLWLALLAALSTGLFLWLMAPASSHGVAWAVFISRVVSALTVVSTFAIRRTSPAVPFKWLDVRGIAASQILVFLSVVFYALSTVHGELTIVSVLASLFPVVTVLLAYALLGERLQGVQRIGTVTVLVGIVLVST